MTSSEKGALWRWIISVVVLSRLAFWLASVLPAYLGEVLPNQVWLDMQISISHRTIPFVITHQFLDPIILGFITYWVGRMYFATTKLGRVGVFTLVLPILLYLSYLIFYVVTWSRFTMLLLSSLPVLGDVFLLLTLALSAGAVLGFTTKGLVDYLGKSKPKTSD